MTFQLRNGTRVTKATFPTTAYTDPDPLLVISQDIVEVKQDDRGNGSQTQVRRFKAGTRIRTSERDRLFDAGAIDTVSPASGPQAGGTVVTISGQNMRGVSSVTFGGTAGTNLQVVDSRRIRVTTPAHAAGAVAVVLVHDAGNVTKTGGYTYV